MNRQTKAVAAAALAGTVYFVSFTIGMGLVLAVAPLAAPMGDGLGGARITNHKESADGQA